MQRIPFTTIHDYKHAFLEAEKHCYAIDMANYVCRVGELINSLNKAHVGCMPRAC